MVKDRDGYDGYHLMWYTPRNPQQDVSTGVWIPQPAEVDEDSTAPVGPKGTQFMWQCNILDDVKLTKKKKLRQKYLKKYTYYSSMHRADRADR